MNISYITTLGMKTNISSFEIRIYPERIVVEILLLFEI